MHAFTMRSMKRLTQSSEKLHCSAQRTTGAQSHHELASYRYLWTIVQHSLIPDPPGSEIDGNGSRVTVSKGDVDKGERACGQKRSPVLADWRSVLIGDSPLDVAFQGWRFSKPTWRKTRPP